MPVPQAGPLPKQQLLQEQQRLHGPPPPRQHLPKAAPAGQYQHTAGSRIGAPTTKRAQPTVSPTRAAHHARVQAEAEGTPVPQAGPPPYQLLQHELQHLQGPPPLNRELLHWELPWRQSQQQHRQLGQHSMQGTPSTRASPPGGANGKHNRAFPSMQPAPA